MAIDFKHGTDSEEKRFLAGILIIHLSEVMKRAVTDDAAKEMKKPNSSYAESSLNRDRARIGSFELLRQRGMQMIGANHPWAALQLDEYEAVCELLLRFDVVREVMES